MSEQDIPSQTKRIILYIRLLCDVTVTESGESITVILRPRGENSSWFTAEFRGNNSVDFWREIVEVAEGL